MNIRKAQLPEGWEIRKLGEVCLKTANIKWTKSPREEYHYIDLSAVSRDNLTITATALVNFENAPSRAKKKIKTGDIIFATTRPTLKRLTIIPENYNNQICSTGFTVLRPNPNQTTSGYLFYSMLQDSFMTLMESLQRGASYPAVTDSDVKGFEIPLPPLPEQQRIVSLLDRAFAAIDQAKANAEKNLQNAKELFESYLEGVFRLSKRSGQGTRESWKAKKLGEIAFIKSGGTPSRQKSEFWTGDIAWYSSGELNNLYTKPPERNINKLAIENSNAKLFPKGSLLIGMYDTAALKMSILDRDATFNQAIAGIKPNSKIDLNFVLHSINAIKPQILNLRRGVRQKNLSLEKIKNIVIAVPSLEEQQFIVRQLDILQAETQKLEALYQHKIADLEELKKSILQKAFNGQLNPQKLLEYEN